MSYQYPIQHIYRNGYRQKPKPSSYRPSSAMRKRVIARDHGVCQLCGAQGNEIDHIIPWGEGGATVDENLQIVCHSCHAEKSGRACRTRVPFDEWLADIAAEYNRLTGAEK